MCTLTICGLTYKHREKVVYAMLKTGVTNLIKYMNSCHNAVNTTDPTGKKNHEIAVLYRESLEQQQQHLQLLLLS